MSIIYNALQKTQQNRSKEAATSMKVNMPVKNLVWLSVGVASIAFFVTMIALYSHLPKTAPIVPVAPSETVKVAAAAQPTFNLDDFKSKHLVTGVYLSNKEKIALINNKFVHPGETVDGMEVVSIESARVILRNQDNALILPVEQAQSF